MTRKIARILVYIGIVVLAIFASIIAIAIIPFLAGVVLAFFIDSQFPDNKNDPLVAGGIVGIIILGAVFNFTYWVTITRLIGG